MEIAPDKTTYTGEFKNGLKHGYGKLTWEDGSEYNGEFDNNLLHGYGT